MMLLDTLQMRRRMREAGFPEEQADAVTEGIANIVAGELATKEDLRALRSEMLDKFSEVKGEIAEVRGEIAEVRGEIAEVKGEVAKVESAVADLKVNFADFKTGIIRWLVGLVVAMLLGGAGMMTAFVVTLLRVVG